MIIRHDLQLVFLHVPKCAGKELRAIIKHGANGRNCIEYFNFDYSETLHRHLDLAHLTMEELAHFPAFQWLHRYTVVAAIRDPYARLRSAINEYYRQFSSEDEAIVNRQGPSPAMRLDYLRQLPRRHSQRDPRFVHSLPITWFTHLGREPMVDHLLRCESLASDFQQLARDLQLPSAMQKQGTQQLRNRPDPSPEAHRPPLSSGEIALANQLYAADFQCFGFPQHQVGTDHEDPLAETVASLTPHQRHSHSLESLEHAPRVEWHWGPVSERPQSVQLCATRQRRTR